MVDADVVGCNWILLPAGRYLVRSPVQWSASKYRSTAKPISHAQIEVDIAWDEFISHTPEGNVKKQ